MLDVACLMLPFSEPSWHRDVVVPQRASRSSASRTREARIPRARFGLSQLDAVDWLRRLPDASADLCADALDVARERLVQAGAREKLR